MAGAPNVQASHVEEQHDDHDEALVAHGASYIVRIIGRVLPILRMHCTVSFEEDQKLDGEVHEDSHRD